MTRPALASAVLEFLRAHIDSHEQLEILLLLRREGPAWWSSHRIRSVLDIPEELVGKALTRLMARGLLATQGEPPQWAYAAASPQMAETVDQLVRSYEIHRFEIVGLMSGNAIERMRTQTLQAFADAFVMRKDKDVG